MHQCRSSVLKLLFSSCFSIDNAQASPRRQLCRRSQTRWRRVPSLPRVYRVRLISSRHPTSWILVYSAPFDELEMDGRLCVSEDSPRRKTRVVRRTECVSTEILNKLLDCSVAGFEASLCVVDLTDAQEFGKLVPWMHESLVKQ